MDFANNGPFRNEVSETDVLPFENECLDELAEVGSKEGSFLNIWYENFFHQSRSLSTKIIMYKHSRILLHANRGIYKPCPYDVTNLTFSVLHLQRQFLFRLKSMILYSVWKTSGSFEPIGILGLFIYYNRIVLFSLHLSIRNFHIIIYSITWRRNIYFLTPVEMKQRQYGSGIYSRWSENTRRNVLQGLNLKCFIFHNLGL